MNASSDEKSSLAGRRILIVHYGEHTPLDEGYRPARMGRLAEYLMGRGCQVTRLVPTYSPFAEAQRPMAWTGTTTVEGEIVMIPTRSYHRSRSPARFGFLRDFAKGAAQAIRPAGRFDAAIVGYPPPGVAWELRRVAGPQLPILADVRDMWPDVLLPDRLDFAARPVGLIGKALAQELRLTRSTVAMSSVMLGRAPKSRRSRVIPIGIPAGAAYEPPATPPTGGLKAVFVGTFSQLFDIDAVLEGWRRFVEAAGATGEPPTLQLVGGGDRETEIAGKIEGVSGVSLVGRVDASEIPAILAGADVGIAPTRRGHGTTFSNKVFEYLSSGLHVVHSLHEDVAAELDSGGHGRHVAWTAEEWAGGFVDAHDRLADIRAARIDRAERARRDFGHDQTMSMWESELTRIVL